MDWFERLTGFRETSYDDTRRRLEVEAGRLRSSANGKSYAIGKLELVSVQTLRERARLCQSTVRSRWSRFPFVEAQHVSSVNISTTRRRRNLDAARLSHLRTQRRTTFTKGIKPGVPPDPGLRLPAAATIIGNDAVVAIARRFIQTAYFL